MSNSEPCTNCGHPKAKHDARGECWARSGADEWAACPCGPDNNGQEDPK